MARKRIASCSTEQLHACLCLKRREEPSQKAHAGTGPHPAGRNEHEPQPSNNPCLPETGSLIEARERRAMLDAGPFGASFERRRPT
eukprot:363067-Chlamydomonas_euryale.AAC.10